MISAIEKNEAEEGASIEQGQGVVAFSRGVRDGISEELAFEQRLGRGEGGC